MLSLAALLLVCGLLICEMPLAKRDRPVLIGALNASWGPTPQVIGLRDGLRELGYLENEDFVIGVRFTQGDVTALLGAARQLVSDGVDIILVDHNEADAQAVLATLHASKIDGVLAPRCCALNLPDLIQQATSRSGVPAMYESAFWVDRGALASYGPDLYASGHMAARLVDKIMHGTDPAEIPVEVNRDVEFVVNLKTARTLGLVLAPETMYRANRFVQ